ncbi:MAG: sulfite exporter TauE/SafE family protein [Nitrospirae bacterium]|nr:sulfite exporter TauE/SafE family protein [Nitrospirota bacterium]
MGSLIGFFGGFFGGLVGVGGGVIMIPAMVSLMKLNQHKAHGTSLVAVVFTGLAGSVIYFLYNAVDWKVSAMLAVSAILTARLGALFAHSLPEAKLRKAFGSFLIFISVMLLMKPYLPKIAHDFNVWSKAGIFLLTGAATGFLSGMMGVGGGTVMIPPMVLLAGMEQHLAQGTSLLAMAPVGISGALTHYKLGNVHTKIICGLVTGAIAGSYLGGAAANMLPEEYLRYVFASVLIWIGLKYLGYKIFI